MKPGRKETVEDVLEKESASQRDSTGVLIFGDATICPLHQSKHLVH
jgi:CRISPR/Cas system CMR subunit Cmr4 (Cas7 group RAMP superfamily)